MKTPAPRVRGRSPGGFTLLEIIVVLAIVLVLMGLVFAVVGPLRRRARRSEVAGFIRDVELACKQFRLHYNHHPWPPDDAGVPWDLTAAHSLPASTVFSVLAPTDVGPGAGEEDPVPTLNPEGQTYLLIPPAFVDRGRRRVVDVWGREFVLRWNPQERALVIVSPGENGRNETLEDDGAFCEPPFGDDVNNL